LRAVFLALKRPRREADHSPQSTAEIKNGGAMPPLPHNLHEVVLSWLCTGRTLPISAERQREHISKHTGVTQKLQTFLSNLTFESNRYI
jgi:hypothetical protein